MLRRYVEQILSIYNYLDGIMVTDKYGYVEYYVTFRPDVNNLKEKDILRKHVRLLFKVYFSFYLKQTCPAMKNKERVHEAASFPCCYPLFR